MLKMQKQDKWPKKEAIVVIPLIHPSGAHLFSECPKGGVYLQFVIMNASYFAVACGEELDGVWFSPDKPNSEPEGDFSLSKQ